MFPFRLKNIRGKSAMSNERALRLCFVLFLHMLVSQCLVM